MQHEPTPHNTPLPTLIPLILMKNFSIPSRTLNLRYKAGLMFFIPLVISISVLSVAHYQRESEAYNAQLDLNTQQLGEISRGGIRHALRSNDPVEVQTVLAEMATRESVNKVWVVNLDGLVKYSSRPAELGQANSLTYLGCPECHRLPPESRPEAIRIPLPSQDFVRYGLPIRNTTTCQTCHPADQPHLGVLLIDADANGMMRDLLWDVGTDLGLTLLTLLISLFLGFALMQLLIVRRVATIKQALTSFGLGDLTVRIPNLWRTSDELTHLAWQFNDMAEKFEILRKEHDEKEDVRVQTIVEERERIARELHDGVAQFLGYASAKTAAILLALNNNKPEVAKKNLEQLEQVINNQSVEVRAAIVGLKMAGRVDEGLTSNVQTYIHQCNRLYDFHSEVEIAEGAEDLRLGAETELQLMRILQESISNVRKHARARQAVIRLEKHPGELRMIIRDDGVGFDKKFLDTQPITHFGMQIMRERSKAIGARVEIDSVPGTGTRITIIVPIPEAK